MKKAESNKMFTGDVRGYKNKAMVGDNVKKKPASQAQEKSAGAETEKTNKQS